VADLLDGVRAAFSDRYVIHRELGHGGMATVFLAEDRKHQRPVAIKVLREEVAASVAAERFLREIRTAAALQHPHILPLHDSGEIGGVLYYVMPYVEGETLRDRLNRERQLPLDEALRVTREVADALAYAHARGIVHRDVKPENVLLSGAGAGSGAHALLADFGIARAISATGTETLTRAGLAIGTPAYMSPEQASGERELDSRSDLYSLGCVLYEMLAGHPPFLGITAQEVLARHSLDPVPPLRTVRPELPVGVDRAVQKALAKSPADRFPSLAAFSDALVDASAPRGRTMARGRIAMAGTAVAVVVLLAGYAIVSLKGSGDPPLAALDGPPSIAVLPFENVGSDPRNEPFSDGVAEDLTTELRKVGRLQVKARTSAFAFKGRNLTSQDIGRRLGTRYIVSGSVHFDIQHRRVNAQLIDVATGNEIWSDHYDSDARAGNAFAVQDTITRAIVSALSVPLSATESVLLQKRSTSSDSAHRLYLQGRYFFEKRDGPSLQKARDYFQNAINADSSYASAYAGLADAYSHSSVFGYVAPREIHDRARAAALRALALDSLLVEGHVALGFVALFLEFDYATAERSFDRALQLDPRYAPAHQFRAWYLVAAGQATAAVEEMRTALQLDPFSLVINARMSTMLYYARRYNDAVAQARRALELDSTFFSAQGELARSLVASGQCEEGRRVIESSPVQLATPFRGLRGAALAKCGRRAEAERDLQRLDGDAAAGRYVSHYGYAAVYAALRERDRALDELAAAIQERAWPMFTLLLEPDFDGLRSDPRFGKILVEAGLRR
jgi:eukaryotic-like serine/threonine-protein kinase